MCKDIWPQYIGGDKHGEAVPSRMFDKSALLDFDGNSCYFRRKITKTLDALVDGEVTDVEARAMINNQMSVKCN